ncbi:Magnesium transport protein CorA [Jeotgalicoccus saudimassiliensis]|uniref:Magnesium transport protein CorA n=1 Tax=Jeotgalicoccus saudimassiliensis TaxID=1461582 RepID=A0A078M1P5_9STAP|nr:CorA family divalent cation transporter [Jeotgalicoccus saudimassiliensis]CEA01308.1 Magnesium transport protein CorA [Jeotgalicoccus saudimassiliensis]
MSLEIQYITKDNQIQAADGRDTVPYDVTFTWYDYNSFDDKEALLSDFELDRGRLEDEATKRYRPQYYNFDDYQLLICHVINSETFEAHAVNIFVMQDIIITYHDGVLDDFIDIAEIIKHKHEDLEIDIALHILHQTVEQYFDIVHNIEDDVILFEEKHGSEKKGDDITSKMFDVRKEIFRVKRVIIPMEELVEKFKEQDDLFNSKRSESILSKIDSKIDRQKLIIKFSEEMIDEMKDNYISYNTYRMNKIINVLTIISAIFLPLTLISGIYGMNFKNMPELDWAAGYYITLGVMLLISVGMISYFKYKRWM